MQYNTIQFRRSGIGLLYGVIAMSVLMMFLSLAVDYGRVQLAKVQLQQAADSAARYAASGISTGITAAQTNAINAAADNCADGSSVTITANDVEFGTWDAAAKSFTVLAGSARSSANAIRVTVQRTAENGNGVPLMFAQVLGRRTCDVRATAIALLASSPAPQSVLNKANPWLAGMPDGTTGNWYDSAPSSSPGLLLGGTGVQPGTTLTFDVTGASSNQAGAAAAYSADGNLGWIIHNYAGSEHGLADVNAPISSLMGVFLNDNQPDTTSAPTSLDFTSSSSRDFATLAPQLKQVFYIGDGRRLDGTTVQEFTIPAGATRLYVGTMDGQQWSDNAGGFTVSLHSFTPTQRVITVR